MKQITIVEYQGNRVLTTAQLAESYDTEVQILTNNFNRNKSRYTEGKHYIALTGQEKRDFLNQHQNDLGSKNAAQLYLWTEKGAWLHAKSLNTDRAWEAYEMLVDEYYQLTHEKIMQRFNIPQNYVDALYLAANLEKERAKLAEENLLLEAKAAEQQAQIEKDKPLVHFAQSIQISEDSILIRDMAKLLKQNGVNIGGQRFFEYLREKGYLIKSGTDKNMPTQKSMNLGIMEVKTGTRGGSNGVTHITRTTKITGKGQVYFINKFLNKLPKVQGE